MTAEVEPALYGAALSLLAHLWSRPLPDDVARWLPDDNVETGLRSLLPSAAAPGLAGRLRGERAGPAGLLEEFERLFVGPGPVPCPPYESYWREDVAVDLRRSLMGPCTAELLALYQDLGLEPVPGTGELPDQLCLELEAAAYALLSEGTAGVGQAIVQDHLARWLPRFCRAVAHEATTDFYRDMAQLTLDWTRVASCVAWPAATVGSAPM
jgi:TorA maturation chaperone TorD